jgi:hypothetical protein
MLATGLRYRLLSASVRQRRWYMGYVSSLLDVSVPGKAAAHDRRADLGDFYMSLSARSIEGGGDGHVARYPLPPYRPLNRAG